MSINKKNAIITFDYEVFLGRDTGSIENCVLRPTQHIIDILSRNNGKAIFFVDASWLLFIRDNFKEEFHKISDQLKEIIRSGSSVELHLHPQWLQALKNGEKITFSSFENYKLHTLSIDEIYKLFSDSIRLLESITGRKIQCFRAGGFCIEPFGQLKEVFEKFNIRYDFSVVPGTYLREGRVYDFDFSSAPVLPYYVFKNDVKVPDEKGRFVEITISTYRNNPFYRILNKALLYLGKDRMFGDGTGIQQKSFLAKKPLRQLLVFTRGMLSIDKTNSFFFRYLINTHFRSNSLLVIISHPKTLSPQGLNNLKYISSNYKLLSSSDLSSFAS